MITVIYGDDNYLVNNRKKLIRESARADGREIESWRADEADSDRIIAAAFNLSLFAERKTVFIDNLETASKIFLEEISNAFCDNASKSLSGGELDVVFVFRERLSPSDKIGKPIKKILDSASEIYEEKPLVGTALSAWARNVAKAFGKELAPHAADILISESGGDMGIISSEIEKCSIAAGDGKNLIDETDVVKNLFESAAGNIFAFASAIEKKDIRTALEELGLLLGQCGEEPLVILDRFQKSFLRIYRYYLYNKEGLGRKDISLRLGLHSYFDRDFFRLMDSSGHSKDFAALAILRSAETNLRLKRVRTPEEKRALIEILVAESLTRVKVQSL